MLHVYLAGAVRGTHGMWRERVRAIPDVAFMHPGARLPGPHEELHTEIYTPADRLAVQKCDVLLAMCDRIEGGHGTAIEIGMALALGKEIILVCPTDESRYVWRFAAGCVAHVYTSLEQALDVVAYAAAQVGGTARCVGA
ncbi:MAG: nucleoside 2-deoxyribosyltransferase [Phycisphaerae bacterium]